MSEINILFDTKHIEFVSRACDILRDLEHRKVMEITHTMLFVEKKKGKDSPELKSMCKELDLHIGFWEIGMEICVVLDEERKRRMEAKGLEGLNCNTTVGKRPEPCGENPQGKSAKSCSCGCTTFHGEIDAEGESHLECAKCGKAEGGD